MAGRFDGRPLGAILDHYRQRLLGSVDVLFDRPIR